MQLMTNMCLLAASGGWWDKVKADFALNFIQASRWKLIVSGLGVTVKVTLLAMVLGLILGIVVAAVRSSYDLTKDEAKKNKASWIALSICNVICKVYLTVIRGTPVVIQLLIIYFIIFASSDNGVMIASLAFGINSGAYVAEIFRSGIMSIDKGQMEAGRSLGFNYMQTMRYIIIPQAFKNVLPALANEFIALLKETSVSGYVAIQDLTRAGNIIRAKTYSAYMPLIGVAVIYLAMVMALTAGVSRLERRLRNSDH